jgi:oligopeptide/dipeptide ABC transporter ATP-binding protein
MKLLDVRNLSTRFLMEEGVVHAVEDVSFSLDGGETLAMVGESGCGKSVLSMSIMRLIQYPPGKIVSGEVFLIAKDGSRRVDILKIPEEGMRHIRGARIGMVFQEPMTALNPVFTIGNQVGEAVAAHGGLRGKELRSRVVEMLKLVGISEPARRAREYPHQLSGGMRQRAMIAMALSCNPDILIADEPTTALDVTIQDQILRLLRDLKEKMGMSMILVTHDLGVVAEMADRVMVMYAGRIVEEGLSREIFNSPMHPYTQGLLMAVRSVEGKDRQKRLATIPGRVPDLSKLPPGCAFADRCPKAGDKCRSEAVPADPCGVGRTVRCFYAGGKA